MLSNIVESYLNMKYSRKQISKEIEKLITVKSIVEIEEALKVITVKEITNCLI